MPHLLSFVNRGEKPQVCGKISPTQLQQQHCSIVLSWPLWLQALITISSSGDRQQESLALIRQVQGKNAAKAKMKNQQRFS